MNIKKSVGTLLLASLFLVPLAPAQTNNLGPESQLIYTPTTPGQPVALEASSFWAAFNEVFLFVDPLGRLNVAPGAVLPHPFTVSVRFMDAPQVESVASDGARLRIVDPLGRPLYTASASPNDESAASATDFYVEFYDVPR